MLTAGGFVCIESIKEGDEVYSCDADTGEIGLKKVQETYVHEVTELVHLTIDDEIIDTTREHPFFLEGLGFIAASELRAGDEIRLYDGSTGVVKSVEIETLENPVNVYNFEVEDWHTYYVGEEGALVHNWCGEDTTSYGKSSPTSTKPKGWKVGDPVDNLTKAGNEPSWSAVRSRYWKNEAYYNSGKYSEANMSRMQKGKAPIDIETGASMELHHKKGRGIENPHSIENLQKAWPWVHDIIDPFRHYTGPRPKGE